MKVEKYAFEVAMKRLCCCLLTLCLLLGGCSRFRAPVSEDFFAMDTLMSVRVWGAQDDLTAVAQEVNRLDAALSVTGSGELAELNRGGTAQLSDETAALLRRCAELSRKTGGCFDPTVYALVRAWGFTTDTQRVPTDAELRVALETVGMDRLTLCGDTATLDTGTMLDLGAAAKGYAAQRCAELLAARGVSAALLQLGGNVQTLGSKPDGSDWAIGIADPDEPTQALGLLHVRGSKAVVTSGGYQRYFERDGVRYHHILDPKTGRPAQTGLASVTVLADDGLLADCYSTALFVMGLEQACTFWRQEQSFEAVFVLESGEIYATRGAADILSGCDFQVIEP